MPKTPAPGRRRRPLPGVPIAPSVLQRRALLRQQWPATLESLQRNRADLVPEDLVDDYVILDWLEWQGGKLRATLTGANVCQQLRAEQKS